VEQGAGSQGGGGREAPLRRAGREGGRRRRRAELSREAGPSEDRGPGGQGGLVAGSPAPQHRRPEADTSGSMSKEGTEVAKQGTWRHGSWPAGRHRGG
jgi:hypothetical protein